MSKPCISILVVNYNTRQLTLECLASVYQEIAAPFELVLVDNASCDGSAEAIADAFPQVSLIRSETNLGFAAANNLAANRCQGDYLLLLNSDTVVLGGAIDRLLAFADSDPAAGIWGGQTLFGDGSFNPTSCWNRATLWSTFCQASGLTAMFRSSRLCNPEQVRARPWQGQLDVDIVTGCFLLIRRELWNQLGGFDPAFFMYGEEADLCLRARELGARPKVTSDACIIHYGGKSERVRADKFVRLLSAKMKLIDRHWSPWARPAGRLLIAGWPFTRALASLLPVPLLGRSRAEKAAAWREVWRRRREWLDTSILTDPAAPPAPLKP